MSNQQVFEGGNSPAPNIETITGNTGGPVGPDGSFNFNILGDTVQGVHVDGTPASNLQTITVVDATSSQKGVASFDITNFTATAGAITSNPFTITAGTGLSGGGLLNLGGVIALSVAATVPLGFTADSGSGIPALNNYNILGQKIGTIAGMATNASGSTHFIENLTWLTPYVVDQSATVGLRGTFQTIGAANAVVVPGQTIAIRSNINPYIEDLILVGGVNYFALSGHSRDEAPNVTIRGKSSVSGTGGSIELFGIRLETNNDYCLSNTVGNSITLNESFINATNHTPIEITNGSANIFLNNCNVNLGTTGIAFADQTAGNIYGNNTDLGNGGGSTTAGTFSGGSLILDNCSCIIPLFPTGTATIQAFDSLFGPTTNVTNQTWITTAGTSLSHRFYNCEFYSGNQTCIVIGANTFVDLLGNCVLGTTATNAISGAGTVRIDSVSFPLSGCNIAASTIQYAKIGDTNKPFTPAITFGGASVGIDYIARTGSYTRVGNIVNFTLSIELLTKGSSTGAVEITGLPFAPAATTIFSFSASSLTFTGMVNARTGAGGNTIAIESFASGGGRNFLTDTAFTNTTFVQVSGSYQVA